MTGRNDRPSSDADRRRRAEEIVLGRAARSSPVGDFQESPENIEALSPEQVRQTLHQLRVHQIELEMQNEELRQAQVELDAARARYFDLYDLAPVGYVTLSEQGLILEANLSAATLLGVARGALVGQPISSFIIGQDHDVYYLCRQQLVEIGDPQACDLRMARKDGTASWVHLAAIAASDADGAPVCRVVLSDITGRKRAEQDKATLEVQLQQARKMELVGRLAGGLAHEFNNMLGAILGNAELALEEVNPAQPIDAYLEEIRKAARRSAALTRQLLAFARRQIVAPRVLDLNDTVAGMLTMLDRPIGEQIHLAWRPAADLWPVKMDPSQIGQILANLCVNARDAITGVGTITVETGNSTIDAVACADRPGLLPGEYVRLVVSDDGRGMDEETLAHIFEPFFTTKGVGEGPGLGLASVYGAVKQNQGFLYVHSEPGAGTTFTVYLPRHVGDAKPLQAAGAAGPLTLGRETILVVEDEPSILDLTTQVLERRGYTVLAASTPGEAFRLARQHAGTIDLIVTDVVMPEMNGQILAGNLRSLYPNLKRLFISGYTADVIAHDRVMDEAVSFLEKPFSINDLAAKVREVLGE